MQCRHISNLDTFQYILLFLLHNTKALVSFWNLLFLDHSQSTPWPPLCCTSPHSTLSPGSPGGSPQKEAMNWPALNVRRWLLETAPETLKIDRRISVSAVQYFYQMLGVSSSPYVFMHQWDYLSIGLPSFTLIVPADQQWHGLWGCQSE